MKEERTMQEKIDLIQAVILVSDFWGVEPANLLGLTAYGRDKKQAEWNKIAQEVTEFYDMGIEDRAKKMGFTVKLSEQKQ